MTGPGAITLWQCARDVRLWSAAGEDARRNLFRAGAGARISDALAALPELAVPVERLSHLLRAQGRGSQAEEIASAAYEVATWAASRELRTTALEYAEAAAFAAPTFANYAIEAGRLANEAGEINRAAAWYGRAIVLSLGNHDAYIRAQLGFGDVMHRTGNHAKSRQSLRRASRVAIKYGRRGLAAQANHQLLEIAFAVGHFEQGVAAARNALERYPVRHPRLPELAETFARLLMQAGYFSSARLLLQQLIQSERGPCRVLWRGMLARCHGGLGDAPRFVSGSEEVLRSANGSAWFAQALVDLAAGAISLGDRDDVASQFARDAIQVARGIGERSVEIDAADLLECVAARGSGRQRDPARTSPLGIQMIVTGFVRRLERRGASGTRGE